MRTVYRYEIPILNLGGDGSFTLHLPIGSTPLHVAIQERAPHAPCVWMLVDTDRELLERRFIITGTGTRMPDPPGNEPPENPDQYIGTFQQHGFVWHVWEVT